MKFDKTRMPIPPGHTGKVVALELARFFLGSVEDPVTLPEIFNLVIDPISTDPKIRSTTMVTVDIGFTIRRMRKAGIISRATPPSVEETLPYERFYKPLHSVTELGRSELPKIVAKLDRKLGGGRGISRECES